MLRVEVEYLSHCPIVKDMLDNVETAISLLELEVDFIQSKIDHDSDSEKYRGCPTLLVDGRDYEGKVKHEKCKPFCREYRNGIPTVEEIKTFILCNY